MNERERDALIGYIRWVANEMELRDWTFDLSSRPADRDCYAQIFPTYGQKHAEISVDENFRTLDADKQAQIIAHELVHCHLEAASNMVFADLEPYLGKAADQIFWNGYKRQMEYGVDALATVIAKHMPNISWPEDE